MHVCVRVCVHVCVHECVIVGVQASSTVHACLNRLVCNASTVCMHRVCTVKTVPTRHRYDMYVYAFFNYTA